jgi:hypothetical protein
MVRLYPRTLFTTQQTFQHAIVRLLKFLLLFPVFASPRCTLRRLRRVIPPLFHLVCYICHGEREIRYRLSFLVVGATCPRQTISMWMVGRGGVHR